ncbi:hypothetical protein P170DRAFT_349060 [Aspergillus steynii IBT 23096]|uniref:Uncharacterized protein n=1 Tax=Aspergillus steynii IBT 23096 TaxID=1392250 RepID=A0A2I2GIB9_9EURO|nr:uncharacterized protein P170DRAFT_349060 [Aspergillus steynii IBT 23096]PLB52623.1 hypothetical protein P170DRAFT_349060 [Aspergillus steynii IBT 23096]
MQPNHYDLLGQVQDEPRPRMTREAHQQRNPLPSRSPSGVAPTRSEDSWIEVSSQPSSSSLSSAATNDDIITTGLRVEQNGSRPYHRRSTRRRLQHLAAVTTAQVDYSSREQSSSQDEYEESESESDRVLSSSNEDVARRPLEVPSLTGMGPSAPVSDDAPSTDDDDNSTALGMRISSSPFVPQPNVFSHPPASQDPSWTRPLERRRSQPSEVSNCSRRTAIRRNSQASIRSARRLSQQQHSPYNMISPSHHADHDAALRASLSTLLSCAAAARGLPKHDSQPSQPPQPGPSRAQPASFRLVPESVAMGDEVGEEAVASAAETHDSTKSPRPRQPSAPMAAYSAPNSPKIKRRSSSPKDRRSSSKKSRHTATADSAGSPTIMTWVISAGVVVLFSAISFSAGYVLGREVGRMEGGMGSAMGDGGFSGGKATAGCGQEAVQGGLKRFRWGSGTSGSGIIA